MFKKIKTILLGILIITLCSCSANTNNAGTNATNIDYQIQARNPFEFSSEILDEIYLKNGNENVMYSPLSLNFAFGLLGTGTTGKSLAEIETIIGTDIASFNENFVYPYLKNTPETLKIANSVWMNTEINKIDEEYQKNIIEYYKSENKQLSFIGENIVKEVNEWVEDKTNGEIKEIVTKDNFDERSLCVLANTAYFKNNWLKSFDKNETYEQTFYSLNGEENLVEFMHEKDTQEYFEVDDFIGIRKNYDILFKNEEGEEIPRFSFLAFKPKNSEDFNFSDFDLGKALENIIEKEMRLSLPKFEFSNKFSLAEILKKNNINEIFKPSKDFENMVKSKAYLNCVSEIIQATKIKVDEKGTTAAAATVITMKRMNSIEEDTTEEITFDHPFGFIIYDNEFDCIMYMGKVVSLK